MQVPRPGAPGRAEVQVRQQRAASGTLESGRAWTSLDGALAPRRLALAAPPPPPVPAGPYLVAGLGRAGVAAARAPPPRGAPPRGRRRAPERGGHPPFPPAALGPAARSRRRHRGRDLELPARGLPRPASRGRRLHQPVGRSPGSPRHAPPL